MAIYTLSIKCVWGPYLDEPFLRTVEVSPDMTLGEMHGLIQELTGFDNDHLATFFMANSIRGRRFGFTDEDDEAEGDEEAMWDIPLHAIFPLPKNKKLYYLFDFGDDWTFQISKKGKDGDRASGVRYPRVIHEEGPKPVQYPPWDE